MRLLTASTRVRTQFRTVVIDGRAFARGLRVQTANREMIRCARTARTRAMRDRDTFRRDFVIAHVRADAARTQNDHDDDDIRARNVRARAHCVYLCALFCTRKSAHMILDSNMGVLHLICLKARVRSQSPRARLNNRFSAVDYPISCVCVFLCSAITRMMMR